MFERQKQLDRPLADVARAPRAAGILFETMRRGEMDHAVVREPGEDRIDGKRVGGIPGALHANAAGDLMPEAVGGLEHRSFVDGLGVFRGQSPRLLGVGHRADDREREFVGRAGPDRGIGAAAPLSVGVEQFVAA